MKQQRSKSAVNFVANPAPTVSPRTPDAMPTEKIVSQEPPVPNESMPSLDENSPEFLKQEKHFREFILSRLPRHKASQGLIEKLKHNIKI